MKSNMKTIVLSLPFRYMIVTPDLLFSENYNVENYVSNTSYDLDSNIVK